MAERPPLRFATLTPCIDRALIIASGPSAMQPWADLLPSLLPVIAVNGAIDKLPRADWWFTLDPSAANRHRMANRKLGTRYVAAVPPTYGQANARPSDLRGPRHPEVTYLHRDSSSGLPAPVRRDTIHTGNSAFGALQLAIHLGARRIGLIGVDATDAPYWHGNGKPRQLNGLPAMFAGVADEIAHRGIEVRLGSVTPKPRVTCFQAMTPAGVVGWLTI